MTNTSNSDFGAGPKHNHWFLESWSARKARS
jgi:hypothetical protein